MKKKIENITMGKTWLTYIGSAYGILIQAGFWKNGITEMAGFTGLAFQFIVHENCCPSSVTVYDWSAVHYSAMDRIGIYTDSLSMYQYSGMNTAEALMVDALKKIKESIDRGIGVIVWAPTPILEFGIITGYDDEQKIFHVIDCANPDPDPLMYENLGKSEVPFLYLQRFLSFKKIDKEKMYRDALVNAVRIWKSVHPHKLYAQGELAYDHLISSLERKSYNPFGLTYVVNVYADTKKTIASFLNKTEQSGLFFGMAEIIERYTEIADHFAKMAEALPFMGPQKSNIDKEKIPEVIKLCKTSKKLETEAMKALDSLLKE